MFFIITFSDTKPDEILEYEDEEDALHALADKRLMPVDDISKATSDYDCIVIEGEKKVFGLMDA